MHGIEDPIRAAGYQIEWLRSVGSGGEVKADVDVNVFRRVFGDDFTSLARGDLAAAIYATIQAQVERSSSVNTPTVDEHRRCAANLEKAAPREFDLVIGADRSGCTRTCVVWSSDRNATSSATSAARSRRAWSTAIARATSWPMSRTPLLADSWRAARCALTAPCSCSPSAPNTMTAGSLPKEQLRNKFGDVGWESATSSRHSTMTTSTLMSFARYSG